MENLPVSSAKNEVVEAHSWGSETMPMNPDLNQTAVEQARVVGEIQAAITVAQKFPRNETACYNRIMQACRRGGLASSALYALPRGNKDGGGKNIVQGPSIRLAEELARGWGNMTYGIRELTRSPDESTMEAFAWDLERNLKITRVFTVEHKIGRRVGGPKILTDATDIYMNAANHGARRMRACILECIPGDITDDAVIQCRKTMLDTERSIPIQDRVRKMVVAFMEFGINETILVKRLGHGLDAINDEELVDLQVVYKSIKEGISKRGDYFDIDKEPVAAPSASLTNKLETQTETKQEAGALFKDFDASQGKMKDGKGNKSPA